MMTESNHIRRPLSSLKVMSQIEKIVDPVIRNLVQGNVGKINNKKGVLPLGLFTKEGRNGFPITKVHLENHKGGDPVPV